MIAQNDGEDIQPISHMRMQLKRRLHMSSACDNIGQHSTDHYGHDYNCIKLSQSLSPQNPSERRMDSASLIQNTWEVADARISQLCRG